TRLVEDNSPCNLDHVQTDLNTWHGYLPGYSWKEYLDEVVKNTYSGSSWNFIGENKQDGAPMFNSECGNVWGYEGSTGDVDFTWDYHIMMNELRSRPLCAGWLYTEHHDVINEWNGYVRFDRTRKYDGMDAFVPGMTLADLHTLYYIAPQGELCREAKAGSTLEIPLFASFMTDKNPGALRIETNLAGWDALGNESLQQGTAYPVTFKPYLNELVASAKTTLPEQKGIYALRYELKNAEGVTLGKNFSLIYVKEGKNPVSDKKMDVVTIDPAGFSKAQWSYKQWNVLDGLKVDGAGSGYFEYTAPWPENLSLEQIESVALIFEASAKRLLGKDVQDANERTDGDYMRGKGLLDPSKNKNAYPMTGEQTFPSYVKITVNGAVCDNVWLPDDPADHRGALSWFSQPHNQLLNEAGSYGYLVKTLVPVAALTQGQAIRIRLEVPEGVNGGLAIYGKAFGRYPLDPTLVFVGK
ncbi:MAG: glycoside hydrolase family 2, partial [Tannerella sp.]|nr:glycoside hydrolase family 2 [Tannerella sp.]